MQIDPHLDFFVSARDKNEKEVTFHMNMKSNGIHTNPEKEKILEKIKLIKTSRGYSINAFHSRYSIAEPYDVGEFNTVIYASIPYCLHLPDLTEFAVNINSEYGEIKVIPKKVWTVNSAGSDICDIAAEDCDTYFNKSEFTSAKMPQDPSLGWQTRFTGKNVDIEKDNTGYFRYTRLMIKLNTPFNEKDMEERQEDILSSISTLTLDVINQLINSYRFVTREEYIEQLAVAEITDIQFLQPNICFLLPNGVRLGIGDALMCHSLEKIAKITNMLALGDTPPIEDMLFLNAESAFNKKMYKLAVVESFQAFEIFLENFLIEKFVAKGLTDTQAKQKITDGQNWMTTKRLKSVLEDAVGQTLPTGNPRLWTRWYDGYDNTRNAVIHQNKALAQAETREVLNTNAEVASWLNQLVAAHSA